MFSGEIKINQENFMSSFPIIIIVEMIIQYHKTGEPSRILLKQQSQISKNSKKNFTLLSTVPSNKFGIRVGCDLYVLSINSW
jgi:hypothetical protein